MPSTFRRGPEAVSWTEIDLMSPSLADGTGPFFQSQAFALSWKKISNIAGTLPPGLSTSAMRSVVPPFAPATLPVESP